jgi:hypothetical protein
MLLLLLLLLLLLQEDVALQGVLPGHPAAGSSRRK